MKLLFASDMAESHHFEFAIIRICLPHLGFWRYDVAYLSIDRVAWFDLQTGYHFVVGLMITLIFGLYHYMLALVSAANFELVMHLPDFNQYLLTGNLPSYRC